VEVGVFNGENVAFFGYDNALSTVATFPFGAENNFSGTILDANPGITAFKPGRHHFVFNVTFTSDDISLNFDGLVASGSILSNQCPDFLLAKFNAIFSSVPTFDQLTNFSAAVADLLAIWRSRVTVTSTVTGKKRARMGVLEENGVTAAEDFLEVAQSGVTLNINIQSSSYTTGSPDPTQPPSSGCMQQLLGSANSNSSSLPGLVNSTFGLSAQVEPLPGNKMLTMVNTGVDAGAVGQFPAKGAATIVIYEGGGGGLLGCCF